LGTRSDCEITEVGLANGSYGPDDSPLEREDYVLANSKFMIRGSIFIVESQKY